MFNWCPSFHSMAVLITSLPLFTLLKETYVSPCLFSVPLPVSSSFHLLQSASRIHSSLPLLHLLSSPTPGDSVHTYADKPHIQFSNMNSLKVPEDISSFVPASALQTFRSHKLNIAFRDLSFFLLYSSSHSREVLNMAQVQEDTMVFRLTCYPSFPGKFLDPFLTSRIIFLSSATRWWFKFKDRLQSLSLSHSEWLSYNSSPL